MSLGPVQVHLAPAILEADQQHLDQVLAALQHALKPLSALLPSSRCLCSLAILFRIKLLQSIALSQGMNVAAGEVMVTHVQGLMTCSISTNTPAVPAGTLRLPELCLFACRGEEGSSDVDMLVASYNRAPLQERKVYIAYMHISPIYITTSFLPAELQRHDTLTANDITGEADSPCTFLPHSCGLLALKHIVILFELEPGRMRGAGVCRMCLLAQTWITSAGSV